MRVQKDLKSMKRGGGNWIGEIKVKYYVMIKGTLCTIRLCPVKGEFNAIILSCIKGAFSVIRLIVKWEFVIVKGEFSVIKLSW